MAFIKQKIVNTNTLCYNFFTTQTKLQLKHILNMGLKIQVIFYLVL